MPPYEPWRDGGAEVSSVVVAYGFDSLGKLLMLAAHHFVGEVRYVAARRIGKPDMVAISYERVGVALHYPHANSSHGNHRQLILRSICSKKNPISSPRAVQSTVRIQLLSTSFR